jgi:hypothetical protein
MRTKTFEIFKFSEECKSVIMDEMEAIHTVGPPTAIHDMKEMP